uniref:Uncharacterized protein n=1 Tax=Anguilla anguilla TaxID=7936 RepID=A0A0E9QZV2_ANGAN
MLKLQLNKSTKKLCQRFDVVQKNKIKKD